MVKDKKAEGKPCAAIILAGGTGTRMRRYTFPLREWDRFYGGTRMRRANQNKYTPEVYLGKDKQYLKILSKPMIEWTVDNFLKTGMFDEIVLVLTPRNMRLHKIEWSKKGVKIARAGSTRINSLKSGFSRVSKDAKLIAVHDGARPLVEGELIKKCMLKAYKYGACVPAVPLKDTIKKASKDGKSIEKTVDRNLYRLVQTPQCYKREILEKILKKADLKKDYSDESQILEQENIKVRVVESDYFNIKITTPEDLIIAEAFMKNKTRNTGKTKTIVARVGFGYDIHRLVKGKPLIMGGVQIPYSKGLLGHSDGDVVLHAVCDSLLGSVAAGEIGMYFPPTDLTIMGLSSTNIAEKVISILKKKHARVNQMDITIVAEEPKLKPYYEEMRKSLAKIFNLKLADVSVKAKSRERLGEVGRGEAMACYVVSTVII
jgi:2-C-methyl-D-erythritol 4-phosphate cytidylyltransferase/2-C-methyl-D-erythritol 2,4-cyclodiphosphate synthase